MKIPNFFCSRPPTNIPPKLLTKLSGVLSPADSKGLIDNIIISERGSIFEMGMLSERLEVVKKERRIGKSAARHVSLIMEPQMGIKYSTDMRIIAKNIEVVFKPYEDGKILKIIVPWHTTWRGAFRNVSKLVKYIQSNSNNDALVRKTNKKDYLKSLDGLKFSAENPFKR